MAGADDDTVDFFSQSPMPRFFSLGASSASGGGLAGSSGPGGQGAGGGGGELGMDAGAFDVNSQADGRWIAAEWRAANFQQGRQG